jgi:hypothetical protein
MDYLKARKVTFALSGADTGLVDTLRAHDLLDRIGLTTFTTAFPRRSTPSAPTQPFPKQSRRRFQNHTAGLDRRRDVSQWKVRLPLQALL